MYEEKESGQPGLVAQVEHLKASTDQDIKQIFERIATVQADIHHVARVLGVTLPSERPMPAVGAEPRRGPF